MAMLSALSKLREKGTQKYEPFCEQITELEGKTQENLNREAEFHALSDALDQTKLNDLLFLNFGGEHVDTVRSTLLRYPGRNCLVRLLSGKYDAFLPRDKNGRIFFDFDQRYVEPVFKYCCDLAMWNGEESTKPVHFVVKYKQFVKEGKVVRDFFKASPPEPENVVEDLSMANDASLSDDAILKRYTETVRNQELKLQNEAETMIAELIFIAKHCGITVPPRSEPFVVVDGNSNNNSNVDLFASALIYIRELNTALQPVDATTAAPEIVDTVTINAGGRLVTTKRVTLQQAAEGSTIADMANGTWNKGFDRDGNIYQDVNSELLVAIINHLRLRQLLSDTNIEVPPIVVYEEQKASITNLLSFYKLTDTPVEFIKD